MGGGVARAGLSSPLFLPAFTSVVAEWWTVCADGSLPSDLLTSLFRAFAGLFGATVVGVLLGIAMARSRLVHWMFDPVIALAFPSPKIAFLPIFILWFGIYSISKILLVAFACVFPIVIGTYARLPRSIGSGSGRPIRWGHRTWLYCSVSCCRRRGPRIFAALRVALPVALITTFTAEMVGGGGGIGATLMYSQRFFESPTVFAYILTMLVVGLVLDAMMQKIQQAFPAWHGNV